MLITVEACGLSAAIAWRVRRKLEAKSERSVMYFRNRESQF